MMQSIKAFKVSLDRVLNGTIRSKSKRASCVKIYVCATNILFDSVISDYFVCDDSVKIKIRFYFSVQIKRHTAYFWENVCYKEEFFAK